MDDPLQLNLFNLLGASPEPNLKLPAHDRFPYNYGDRKVKPLIFNDLRQSRRPMIISGYTSLSMIIEFLALCYQDLERNPETFETIQILIGNEPAPTGRSSFRLNQHDLPQEMQRYWLEERGISIFLCAKVIVAIELIRNGKVQVRLADRARPMHAKIFKGDNAIVSGSSNFSHSGLELQYEINHRYERTKEKKRFEESCQVAESYWQLGRDYQDELITLLELLLSVVTWQEALARACAELLEGEWAGRYIRAHSYGDEAALWPSQQQGIAHALWVIENVGSVLIADATGSGKTRTGAHLIRSAIQRMWGTGRIQQEIPVLLCPPNVEESWRSEVIKCGQSVEIRSHGILSHSTDEKRQELLTIVRRAQVLAVDEAHRFLNLESNRTKFLFNNIADHVLLFTATPISKGPQDLIAIVDLLGADNFDDDILDTLSRIRKRQGRFDEKVSKAELEKIQRSIQQFTVRRTKTMLNRMIDANPEAFRDKRGRLCRYPRHDSKTYRCDRPEHEQDCQLAKRIRETAAQLRGLIYLQKPIEIPEFFNGTPEKFLDSRLNSASALVMYNIMASLRSSRACLLEHIEGTAAAKAWDEISTRVKTQDTGNVIAKLRQQAEQPPDQTLTIEMPAWLAEGNQYQQACLEEIRLYEQIAELTRQMSPGREDAKTEHLINLLRAHSIVIAFDRNLITLATLRDRIGQHSSCEVVVATGSSQTEKNRANQICQLGSAESGVIVLCSDAMSEGINLQQASAVVNLDMPTVVRIAEQRIGRIDRLDSPHPTIEVFFPKDDEAFTLSSDQRFLSRVQFVSEILGSNMPLPDELLADVILPNIITKLEETEQTGTPADSLLDAFAPVRSLVEGDQALIEGDLYQRLRDSDARVIASVQPIESKRISVVAARRPWVFFAIAGTKWGAPRWVYLDRPDATPITDLEDVSQHLRHVLDEGVSNLPQAQMEKAAKVLRDFLQQLRKTEELLLPRKKQRALQEMRVVLQVYQEESILRGDRDREELTRKLLGLTQPESEEPVDLGSIAERWLDLIRPVWYDQLTQRRRASPLRLRDIRQVLIEQEPLKTEDIQAKFSELRFLKPLDERIVAAIVGVA
ncbi:MAG: helicase [Verrucomicrobia bacterium]|nr:helicase [Leptolyngbya sp. ES-bin-22]